MTRRTSGFTLIELLVVIAIIAILAAMLFPVFARARESARKIQCLSNVKNIATAVQMYLTDYDRLPPRFHNPAEIAYFAGAPGGDEEPQDCCNKTCFANPYLRWPVIFDEYVRNRDVWTCPSAKKWNGAEWITPDYGKGFLQALKDTEGRWGRSKPGCPGGPCCISFPPGWGGTITDSIAQQSMAGGNTNSFETTVACSESYEVKDSQISDPAKLIVAGDATRYVWLQLPQTVLYDISVTFCGNWENDPGQADGCVLDSHDENRWYSDASFRRPYTRHLGGSNIGFADGHASWWAMEAFEAAVPYCQINCAASTCTVIYENRPLRGLCPSSTY